jgi:hypothetical protein
MENAPKSPIPILIFRNYSAVVAKFRFEQLSGAGVWPVIVGLNVALKGPYPLVGESEVSRTDRKNFQFIWNTYSKNQSI